MNRLITIDAATQLIHQGLGLSIAGPESALDQLPLGNWIGWTIPYFMVEEGGVVSTQGKVFVNELASSDATRIAHYPPDGLHGILDGAPDNGYSVVIIPAGSQAHQRFAFEAPTHPDAFVKPAVGWIAGVHLSEIGSVKPKVYDGITGEKFEDQAVVLYVSLPQDKLPTVEIVNLFEPDDGDVLNFDEAGMSVGACRVNGEPTALLPYLQSRKLDHGRLPLVGDFAGARINASIQRVDPQTGLVHLYAPVFAGVDYHFARPVPDYAAEFRARIAELPRDGEVLTCNCILNFVFGELEGKEIGGMCGPVTFGEIAYQLLNQTLVVLRVI